LAQALNCDSQSVPCGQCRACKLIAAGKHPDLRLVAPEGNALKIDQVRALQHDLALSPVEGRFRVAILEGMEKATAEASNALLKTLEEPPPHVVLVLIARAPRRLDGGAHRLSDFRAQDRAGTNRDCAGHTS
jgi:DNA polymerase III subunit delta'